MRAGFSTASKGRCAGIAVDSLNVGNPANLRGRHNQHVEVGKKAVALISTEGEQVVLRSVNCRHSLVVNETCINCKSAAASKRILRNVENIVKRAAGSLIAKKRTNNRYLPKRVILDRISSKAKDIHVRQQNQKRKESQIRKLKKTVKQLRSTIMKLADSKRFSEAMAKLALLSQAETQIVSNHIKNVNRKRQGHYSDDVKLFFRATFLMAKPRSYAFIVANMNGPAISTIKAYSALENIPYRLQIGGPLENNFKLLSEIYARVAKKIGYSSKLGAELCEDETRVRGTVVYDEELDCLVGLCGTKKHKVCDPAVGYVSLNNLSDEEVVSKMLEAVSLTPAPYIRVVIVNPLNRKFPRLILMVQTTCLKFNSQFVHDQWAAMERLYSDYLEPFLGPLVAHSSDGDARRRKLFDDMYSKLSLFGLMAETGVLGDPDYIHNAKKLYNQLDSARANLIIGHRMATIVHLVNVVKTGDCLQHGLRRTDVSAKRDRMDFEPVQRAAKTSCITALMDLNQDHNWGASGTIRYLNVIRNYLQIFLDKSKTWAEKIECALYVFSFLKLWKSDIERRPRLSVSANFISLQCFVDVTLSCLFVVGLCCKLRDSVGASDELKEFNLEDLGTDCCEQSFSATGVWESGARTYDAAFFVKYAMHVLELRYIQAIDTTGMKFPRARPNIESIFQSEYDKEKKFDPAVFPTNEEIETAFKASFSRARSDLIALGALDDLMTFNDFELVFNWLGLEADEEDGETEQTGNVVSRSQINSTDELDDIENNLSHLTMSCASSLEMQTDDADGSEEPQSRAGPTEGYTRGYVTHKGVKYHKARLLSILEKDKSTTIAMSSDRKVRIQQKVESVQNEHVCDVEVSVSDDVAVLYQDKIYFGKLAKVFHQKGSGCRTIYREAVPIECSNPNCSRVSFENVKGICLWYAYSVETDCTDLCASATFKAGGHGFEDDIVPFEFCSILGKCDLLSVPEQPNMFQLSAPTVEKLRDKRQAEIDRHRRSKARSKDTGLGRQAGNSSSGPASGDENTRPVNEITSGEGRVVTKTISKSGRARKQVFYVSK